MGFDTCLASSRLVHKSGSSTIHHYPSVSPKAGCSAIEILAGLKSTIKPQALLFVVPANKIITIITAMSSIDLVIL